MLLVSVGVVLTGLFALANGLAVLGGFTNANEPLLADGLAVLGGLTNANEPLLANGLAVLGGAFGYQCALGCPFTRTTGASLPPKRSALASIAIVPQMATQQNLKILFISYLASSLIGFSLSSVLFYNDHRVSMAFPMKYKNNFLTISSAPHLRDSCGGFQFVKNKI
jgi:hypothetical protein